jgi:hypothetical protein
VQKEAANAILGVWDSVSVRFTQPRDDNSSAAVRVHSRQLPDNLKYVPFYVEYK